MLRTKHYIPLASSYLMQQPAKESHRPDMPSYHPLYVLDLQAPDKDENSVKIANCNLAATVLNRKTRLGKSTLHLAKLQDHAEHLIAEMHQAVPGSLREISLLGAKSLATCHLYDQLVVYRFALFAGEHVSVPAWSVATVKVQNEANPIIQLQDTWFLDTAAVLHQMKLTESQLAPQNFSFRSNIENLWLNPAHHSIKALLNKHTYDGIHLETAPATNKLDNFTMAVAVRPWVPELPTALVAQLHATASELELSHSTILPVLPQAMVEKTFAAISRRRGLLHCKHVPTAIVPSVYADAIIGRQIVHCTADFTIDTPLTASDVNNLEQASLMPIIDQLVSQMFDYAFETDQLTELQTWLANLLSQFEVQTMAYINQHCPRTSLELAKKCEDVAAATLEDSVTAHDVAEKQRRASGY